MVLLIPDAVRKIKAQGYAEGRTEGLAEGRQEVRQLIEDAVLEYCRREGMGENEPIPLTAVLDIIDDTIPRNTTAPRR